MANRQWKDKIFDPNSLSFTGNYTKLQKAVVNEDLGGHWLTGQREFTLKELRTMFKSVFDKQ